MICITLNRYWLEKTKTIKFEYFNEKMTIKSRNIICKCSFYSVDF